jgi:hypothetical protein
MLRSTKVEIELLTDIDKILFVEGNIRGGVSFINQRYCEEHDAESEAPPTPTESRYCEEHHAFGESEAPPTASEKVKLPPRGVKKRRKAKVSRSKKIMRVLMKKRGRRRLILKYIDGKIYLISRFLL